MINRQKGVALLMSLVILLILSLLATSSMQNSIMQERMSTSSREGMLALEAAEAALREAEELLEGVDMANFGSENGFYEVNDGDVPSPFDDTTWSSDENDSIAGSTVNGLDTRYYFELRGPVTLDGSGELPRDLSRPGSSPVELESARIVVMAPLPSGNGRRMIESYYVFDTN